MNNSYCILGNPNVGKTSLFNALTGTYEYVGNWSGVTVEKKVGRLKENAGSLIDLPGIYELSPISKDETVVTDYLLNNEFSGMINIIDASQLKRNLQLTVQLMELGAPIIIGLNMIDVATKRGIRINQTALMKKLKLPLLPIIARSGKGTTHLLHSLKDHSLSKSRPLKINYGEKLEDTISRIEKYLSEHTSFDKQLFRFIAIQFLLDNPKIHELLEDSGYMTRIAILMDRIMETFGLSGKSFIPMIIGFGCNVPSIMAARSIESEKERLTTILIAPFMSCSARLPVYALFVGVFFEQNQALIVLSLYVLGIVIALLTSVLLTKTVLKNDDSVFIVELPTYRLPSIKTLWRSTWEKAKGFVKKAGTFIFAGSVVIWLLNYTGPSGFNVDVNDSFLHSIGSFFAVLVAPLGFGTWQAGATLIPGFLAKEVIVSSMAIIYASDEDGLVNIVQDQFTSLSAYAFMIFILLYIPCLSTVATIRKETYSLKWTIFAVAYPLIAAYVLTFIFYQVCQFFI
ncbi:ferrous iron transport protein B [Staphylococcus equorum]|uniref:ferrous iron transport protein B n=1 Tax=Staphylococcus equorum TaxID=246432 RepID=UPI0025571AD4|nr:ferrous iron transport protein B [Staphylococcus equorum]MDK9869690.1 ferrous iron transport protein B [Staphylococcus equorum]